MFTHITYTWHLPHQLYAFIIYQFDKHTKPTTHKHILVQLHTQQSEPWVIHLWIRIRRLYMTHQIK